MRGDLQVWNGIGGATWCLRPACAHELYDLSLEMVGYGFPDASREPAWEALYHTRESASHTHTLANSMHIGTCNKLSSTSAARLACLQLATHPAC